MKDLMDPRETRNTPYHPEKICGWKTGLLSALVVLTTAGLCGCGPQRVRADFHNYENAYAETSNREMLLNLARLQNRDPTYFFKLGQITSSYRMQATLTGNGAYTPQGTVPGGAIPSGGGTPGFLYENDPVFQFIPVNDETNAELLMKPIPAETLYILYQQGWRVDQLFRLMVDRIELTRSTGHGCEVQVIHNSPPPVYLLPDGTPDKSYAKEQEALTNYVTFLRVSAIVYSLQKHGLLLLGGSSSFVPFDKNSSLDPGADNKNAPQVKDINDAAAKSTVWEKDAKGNWNLGQVVFQPSFYLNPVVETKAGSKVFVPDEAKIAGVIQSDLPNLAAGPALATTLKILASGFSIEGTTNQQGPQDGPCPASETSSHLVMRSMMGMMAAAAQEQAAYDLLASTDPTVPLDPHIPATMQEAQRPDFKSAVPTIEQIPLMRLTWDQDHEPNESLVKVNYHGQEFAIADLTSAEDPANATWNRDMFRLISQLASQVTVDISKFPLPEILQLHAQ
jgi:hypothetical protein